MENIFQAANVALLGWVLKEVYSLRMLMENFNHRLKVVEEKQKPKGKTK